MTSRNEAVVINDIEGLWSGVTFLFGLSAVQLVLFRAGFQGPGAWYFSNYCSKHRLWVLVRIKCGYTLELPQRGDSNVYHNLCF